MDPQRARRERLAAPRTAGEERGRLVGKPNDYSIEREVSALIIPDAYCPTGLQARALGSGRRAQRLGHRASGAKRTPLERLQRFFSQHRKRKGAG